jgi:ABC-2 type transport system permease protein
MWKLLQIELFKISKRPRTYIAFTAVVAIAMIFQLAFKVDGKSYLDFMLQDIPGEFNIESDKMLNGYFMCYIILNTLLIQVPILIAFIAGDAISGEANMGTLRLLVSKPISRTEIIIAKFAASVIFTILLLVWMAVIALFFSILIFGVNDMAFARTKGVSEILTIPQDDVMWRYAAAFAYATVALTVISSLALLLSIFAENSIGPIIITVSIVIICTVITNINVPVIDRTIKPWLFTSDLVGWKGFFYIRVDDENVPIKGSMENWPAVRNSLFKLSAYIVVLLGTSILVFRKKDILS